MNKTLKTALILFIAVFFIFSKLFIQNVLKQIEGFVEYEYPSEKGLLFCAVMVSLAFLAINFLVNNEIL